MKTTDPLTNAKQKGIIPLSIDTKNEEYVFFKSISKKLKSNFFNYETTKDERRFFFEKMILQYENIVNE